MANAFISGRRYPTEGGAVIPAGKQSFTSNGTFTAPYTGVYTVVLTAGHAASGKGGNGGNAGIGDAAWGAPGGGGGAGGSAYNAIIPAIALINLTVGDQIPITINNSIISFGNYASFSTGTSPGNGNQGGAGKGGSSSRPGDREAGKGGAGGAGGGKPLFSHGTVLSIIAPNLPDIDLSGQNGKTGRVGIGANGPDGGSASNSIYGIPGQSGGCGQATYDRGIYTIGVIPYSPIIPAAAGRIDITWGNQ